MKKLICFALTVFMLATLAVPAVAVEKNSLTADTAAELIVNAYSFFYFKLWPWETNGVLDNKIEPIDAEIDGYITAYNNYPDSTLSISYHKIVDASKLPGSSIDGMKAYLETIYTKESAIPAYTHLTMFASIDSKPIPMFKYDEQGNAYIASNEGRQWASYECKDAESIKNNIVINSNGNTATAYFPIVRVHGMEERETVWVSCEFKNTENGWRISGGYFYELMNFSYKTDPDLYSTEAPDTGDSSFTRIAFFGALALAALVPPALLIRKKRREF